jgi:hypothetical protein
MGKFIKYTNLSAEEPGPRACAEVRLELSRSLPAGAGGGSGTGFGWLDAQVQESWDEDLGPEATLEDI